MMSLSHVKLIAVQKGMCAVWISLNSARGGPLLVNRLDTSGTAPAHTWASHTHLDSAVHEMLRHVRNLVWYERVYGVGDGDESDV